MWVLTGCSSLLPQAEEMLRLIGPCPKMAVIVSTHWHQEQHSVWKPSAALSVMSGNEKINHQLERLSPLRLSLEEVELQWAIKRTTEPTGGALRSLCSPCVRGWRLGKRYRSMQAVQQKNPETRAPLKRRVERNQYHYWQCKSVRAEKASR
uniref:Uncharacterized protein n=1 Tax=Acanthochromis polyacanthus TaxID=80966 RepID=A0A3Q1G688_9TELE